MQTAAEIRDAMVLVAKQMQRPERAAFAALFERLQLEYELAKQNEGSVSAAAEFLRQHAS